MLTAREQCGGAPCPAPGLFCFVVIAHEFGEVQRAINILDSGSDAGFSGCDSWRIYSNVSHIPNLSDHKRCRGGLCVEKAIRGSMDVPLGRPIWAHWPPTALNIPVFRQVWKHVLTTSPYTKWAWTVKTEVDAVFAASHLRSYLMTLGVSDRAVVGINGFGPGWTALFGPVEAVTLHALALYAAMPERCDLLAEQLGHELGEDYWFNQCMGALGVDSEPMSRQLLDNGSGHNLLPGLQLPSCNGTHVAYHPRRSTDLWNSCYRQICGCTSEQCDKTGRQGCGGTDDGTHWFYCCCLRPGKPL